MERRWLRWESTPEHCPDPRGYETSLRRRVRRHCRQPHRRTSRRSEQTRTIASAAELARYQHPGGRFSDNDPCPCDAGVDLICVLPDYARHAGHLHAARELDRRGTTGELRDVIGLPHKLEASRVRTGCSQRMTTEEKDGPRSWRWVT
jgi:hypothetical protein